MISLRSRSADLPSSAARDFLTFSSSAVLALSFSRSFSSEEARSSLRRRASSVFAAFSSFSVSLRFSSVRAASFSVCFLRSAFCFCISARDFSCSFARFSQDCMFCVSWAFFSSRVFIFSFAAPSSFFALRFSSARWFASRRVSASWAFLPSSSVKLLRRASRAALSFFSSVISAVSRAFSSTALAPFSAAEVISAFFFARAAFSALAESSSPRRSRTVSTQASSFGAGLFGMSLQYSVIRRSDSPAWRMSADASFVRRLYVFPHMVTVTFSLSISFPFLTPSGQYDKAPLSGRNIHNYIIQYTKVYCKPFFQKSRAAGELFFSRMTI